MIVNDPLAHSPPTLAQAESYSESRSKAIEHQQRSTYEYEEKKRIEMQEKHRDKIELKRKQKQEKLKLAAAGEEKQGFEVFVPEIKEGQETTGPPTTSTSTSKMNPPDLSAIPYTILIDTSSSSYPWYNPSSSDSSPSTHSTLEAAAEAKVWNYPTTKLQESRCRVFEDLWKKGFYMGGGLRFGGDFLVYPGTFQTPPSLLLELTRAELTPILLPGDPLRYHSHFTLTVLSTPVTTIMPLDLVAYGRLATAVKKAHLLSSWNDEEDKADYLSLEWAAFG